MSDSAIHHLSRIVDRSYGLLLAGADEEADDDCSDVDEEVAPGVGRVAFEHAWLRAGERPMIPYLEIAVRGGWTTRFD